MHNPETEIAGAGDTLVQGALIELFDAYGVILDPVVRVWPPYLLTLDQVVATIDFIRDTADANSERTGRVTLSMPRCVFALVTTDEIRHARSDDWARELVNQLIGRIKNRLLQLGVAVRIGLPSNVMAISLSGPATPRVYAGRTAQGDVLVLVEGLPHDAELACAVAQDLALEGDLILF